MSTPQETLMQAFDDLTVACQRVECALPQQMTAAIAELEHRRKQFRALFHPYMVAQLPQSKKRL